MFCFMGPACLYRRPGAAVAGRLARRAGREKGQVIVVVAIALLALLGAIGLAVDSGFAYMSKVRLNTAVDAAAIAAARASVNGNDQAAQSAAAKAAAQDFFAANYPPGYMGSNAVLNDPGVTFDKGRVIVDVSAQASSPVSFMRLLGFTTTDVSASSQSIRSDLDMALVVDTTGSLSGDAAAVKSASKLFLDKFNTNQDRMALVHFATGAVVDVPINKVSRGFDRNLMKSRIDAFSFANSTNSAEGFWHGRDQLKSIAQANRSTLRAIVFFSDGAPNSFSSVFPFVSGGCTTPGTIMSDDSTYAADPSGLNRIDQTAATLAGCYTSRIVYSGTISRLPTYYNAHDAGTNSSGDPPGTFSLSSPARNVNTSLANVTLAWRNVNRAARNLVEAMASKARSEGIYVFTLGLGPQLQTPSGPDNEKGEDILKCLANTPDSPSRCYQPAQPSGVYCHAATSAELTPCFSRLASEILRLSR